MRALFISDLHLTEDRPRANERFFDFLEHDARGADALFVLGDLFEYWVGDDDLADPFNAVIAGFFGSLSRSGTRVHVMHGNRDFLVGERFCRETGAHLIEDPAVLELDGRKTLLMHGDTLCTDDADYQAWRRTARSSQWQADFLSRTVAERRGAVRALREKSKEVILAKPAQIMDVNQGAVLEAFRRHGASRLIHGHTHRPGSHLVDLAGTRCERWVLPDWYGPGGYLEVLEGAPRLVHWS